MLMQNRPAFSTGRCRLDDWLMQTRSVGGAIDSEQTAVAVMPKRRLSEVVETMLTALANVRMALRKSLSSASPMAASAFILLSDNIIAPATVVNASNTMAADPLAVTTKPDPAS